MNTKAEFEKWYVELDHVVDAIDGGIDVLDTFEVDGVVHYVWQNARDYYAEWQNPGVLKVSHIIELAKHSPKYPAREGWLCTNVWELESHGIISEVQVALTKQAISRSLSGYTFLRGKMIEDGTIEREVQYDDEKYLRAAVAHWDNLIAELRAKGE